MAKNPVMPVYYNDLRGATLAFTDEEFGAYVRLLIYQWDKGHVPGEMKRIVMIAPTAQAHWALLSTKFKENTDGTLYNEYLEEVRAQKKKHSEKQAENVKKRYQTSTNALTNDTSKTTPLEDEKEIEKNVLEIIVPGEVKKVEPVIFKDETVLIVPELVALWKDLHKDYVVDNFVDFPAVRQIAAMIAAKKKMTYYTGLEAVTVIKNNFSAIIEFAETHSLYKDFQLTQISKYFNAIVSAMNNANKAQATGVNGKQQTSLVKNNVATAAGARDLLAEKYGDNGKGAAVVQE